MSISIAIYRKLTYLSSRFLIYLDIQLFLSLCAWPLLAVWGLPFSPASMLGNLLFTPFLSLFLFVSSLIFFCELVSLPHGIVLGFLEAITSVWSALLSLGNRSWLFIGAHPPLILSLLLPPLACSIMLIRPFSHTHRILLFTFIYFICGFLIPYYPHERTLLLPYETQRLTIIQSRGKTVLIDPGVLGRRISSPQKILHTLVPYLISQGIRSIDILVVPKPSHMVFKALGVLIDTFPVTEIYLPEWRGDTLQNPGWSSWETVVRKAQDRGTLLTCVRDQIPLTCGARHLVLTPAAKSTKRNKFVYHALIVHLRATYP